MQHHMYSDFFRHRPIPNVSVYLQRYTQTEIVNVQLTDDRIQRGFAAFYSRDTLSIGVKNQVKYNRWLSTYFYVHLLGI